jgi:hypothetical protein
MQNKIGIKDYDYTKIKKALEKLDLPKLFNSKIE